ncbi:HAD family hydrolase [Gammaproteobacteria bacterium]|nr:HAD family hydrolase [Gammaproteobacteria bacterium]
MKKNKALFLDRDGVINIDYGYVHQRSKFTFINGIFSLVEEAKNKGYFVVIVTNQAGIGRGLYTEKDFQNLMNWVKTKFVENNGFIDDVFFSPFHPVHGIGYYKQDSDCRKPNPGMILKAANKYSLNLSDSILVGDKTSDAEAGKKAGVGKNIIYNDNLTIKHNYKFVTRIDEVINYL